MNLRTRSLILVTVVLMLVGLTAGTALALQTCGVVDTETEEVLPGVTLTWDSSFLCADAPDSDTYQFTVTVNSAASSSESVTIESIELTHTTPRPGGSGPSATGTASGLPLSLAPGGSGSFTVSGTYELVQTDEGKKANLHFQAHGAGDASGESFSLGINAHFRAPGATESGGGAGTTSGDGAAVGSGSEAGQASAPPAPSGVPAGGSAAPGEILVQAGSVVAVIDRAIGSIHLWFNGLTII